MTRPAYALIGRSYPSEAYELLYRISLAARARRRELMRSTEARSKAGSPKTAARRWRGSGEPVTLPARLAR